MQAFKFLRLRACSKPYKPHANLALLGNCCEYSSSSKNEDEDELKTPKKDEDELKTPKKDEESPQLEDSKQKMRNLLLSLHKVPSSTKENIQLFKPHKNEKSKLNAPEDEGKATIDMSLKKAVKDVAQSLEGEVKKTESELLDSLQSVAANQKSVRNILSGMQVKKSNYADLKRDRKPTGFKGDIDSAKSRLHMFQRGKDRRAKNFGMNMPKELFGASPLGIFVSPHPPSEGEKESLNPVWEAATKYENNICVKCAPVNYFEQMIEWTEEGKLWKFPVDNEIGLEEEKSCSFADHIFLERHLEGWCPPKGPLRHFMELVCVGLSMNPHLTVARKKAHIMWYKDYFEEKSQLLRELKAM